MKDILLNIEALIFASEEGISAKDLKTLIEEALEITISSKELADFLAKIQVKYAQDDYVFALEQLGEAYHFLTKASYHPAIRLLQSQKDSKKLSQAALETLAIIAYRQPVTKLDVEQIRGVSSDYSIQKLLEKKLIKITGKATTLGKPLLYGTSAKFMNYFGINSNKELPQLKDLVSKENQIGESID